MSFRPPAHAARWALLGLVGLLGAGLSACAPPGPADAETAPGCTIWDDLTEKIVATSVNELGGPFPSLGNSLTYIAQLYDASGKQIAYVLGRTDVSQQFTSGALAGDLQGHTVETIELPGGTVRAQGIYNLTRQQTGASARIGLIGTGGGYRDRLGDRYFQTGGPDGSLKVRLEMCKSNMLRSGR